MRGWRQKAIAGLVVAAAGLALMVLWPAGLGGPVTYLTTHGVSMEPRFHQGDLVLIRGGGQYRIGDVVAYHSHTLDTVVMHRIVDRHGDTYVFKGDNNHWLDPDQPTKADLVGAVWLHIPQGGLYLNWLRQHALMLIGAALLLSAAGIGIKQQRPRRATSGSQRGRRTASPKAAQSSVHVWRSAAVALSGVAMTAAAVAAVGYSRRTSTAHIRAVPYTQYGTFGYSAPVSPGPVYATATVATGDTVFLRVLQAINVSFDYRLAADHPRAVSGTVALHAEIAESNGWNRTVELVPPTNFTGEHAHVAGVLDIARLQQLAADAEAITGVQDRTRTVTVVPDVTVTGTLGGLTLRDTMAPRLEFSLDPLQLRLDYPAGAGAASVLAPSTGHSVQSTIHNRTQLTVWGRHLAVGDARSAAGYIGIPALLGAAFALGGLRRRWRDEASRIELRHRHRLVPVASTEPDGHRGVIEVATMEHLARLADQHGCLILHQHTDRGHLYLFRAYGIVFRYAVRSPRSPSRRLSGVPGSIA